MNEFVEIVNKIFRHNTKPVINIIDRQPIEKNKIKILSVQDIKDADPGDGKSRLIKIGGKNAWVLEERILGMRQVFIDEVKQGGDHTSTNTLKIGDENFSERSVNKLRQIVKARKDLNAEKGKTLYRVLALQYHPDLYQSEDDLVKSEAADMFRTLTAMYDNKELD